MSANKKTFEGAKSSNTPIETRKFLKTIFSITDSRVKGSSPPDINKLIESFLPSLSDYTTGQMVYIVDYSKQEIVYSSGFNNNLGFPDPITISTLYDHIHPNDIFTVLKLAKASITYAFRSECEDVHTWTLAHDYRIRDHTGKYRRFLRHSFIAYVSEDLQDFYTINLVSDISFIKKVGPVEWDVRGKVQDWLHEEISRELSKRPSYGGLLSVRETEILYLLSRGINNEDISRNLNISIMTTKTHRRNIMKKMGVKNTSELIYEAIKHGIL